MQIFDISNVTSQNLLSTYPTLGTDDLVVYKDIIYVADDLFGLTIINVSDPRSPILLNSFSPSINKFYSVTVSKGVAYLAEDSFSGLQLVNIINPSNPILLSTYVTAGDYSSKIGISNFTAYVTQAAYGGIQSGAFVGVQIIGVSAPANPTLLGNFATLGSPVDIFIDKSQAYVIDEYAGLLVLNLSIPSKPTVIKTFPTIGAATAVTLSGNLAYVAISSGGLQIINTKTNPNNFDNVITIENKAIIDVAQQNNTLFYTIQNTGLILVNSSSLNIASSIPTLGYARAIIISNNIAYIAADVGGLQILDLQSFKLLANYNITTDDVIVLGRTAYLKCSCYPYYGQILNLTVITNPTLVKNLPFIPLTISNSLLYATNTSNFQILDISNQSNPVLLGSLNFGVRFSVYVEFAVVNEFTAYVGLSTGNMAIINVQNSSDPFYVSYYEPWSIVDLDVVENIGYLYSNHLLIVEVSDPSNIQLLSRYTTLTKNPNIISGSDTITIHSDIAYLAIDLKIELVNISDPTNPHQLRIYHVSGLVNGITIFNKSAYVAEDNMGIQVIDLSLEQSSFYTSSTSSQVVAINGVAYLSDNEKNLYILNISDITNPSTINIIQLNYLALEMIIESNYLFIAEGLFGVEILDISNVALPKFAGRITSGLTNVKSVKVEGNKLYVIDNYRTIVVFDINPIFYLSGLIAIQEGQRLVVSPAEVAVTGFNGVSASQLMMTALNITHAQFELSTQAGIPITSFTLAQVQASQIIFVQDGGKIAPSFDLLVSDGTTTKGPFTANILFQPINYPPVLGFHFIQSNEGQSVILNISNFNATDDLTPALQLQFITTLQSNSQFEQITQPGVIVTRFSQQDLVNGYILFRHLDQSSSSDLTPFCMISVFDGQLYSTPVQIQFSYHVAPKFITNQLTIYRGQVLTISANELQAIDPQDVASSLIFIINNVTHGTFTKNIFTQGEITIGLIQFQHDGSDQSPSYSVSIQDPFMITGSQPALVTFTDKNPNLALNTEAIAGTVAGGVVGLGLLIGGIFAYRNYARNEQSRKNNLFAASVYQALRPVDAANFSSSEGQQFVQALQTLKQELSQQGIDVDRMGTWELNQLAEQITLAIQQEISSKTNWRSESEVSGDDISQSASQLGLAIQKIRAGLYEPVLTI